MDCAGRAKRRRRFGLSAVPQRDDVTPKIRPAPANQRKPPKRYRASLATAVQMAASTRRFEVKDFAKHIRESLEVL